MLYNYIIVYQLNTDTYQIIEELNDKTKTDYLFVQRRSEYEKRNKITN